MNMVPAHGATALVTLLALVILFWTMAVAGRARGKAGLKAPAMTGDPAYERANRVHMNTLENIVPFLVALWLCAIFLNAMLATIVGLVWCIGRVVYALAYWKDPSKRTAGFAISFLASVVLIGCAAYGGVRLALL